MYFFFIKAKFLLSRAYITLADLDHFVILHPNTLKQYDLIFGRINVAILFRSFGFIAPKHT